MCVCMRMCWIHLYSIHSNYYYNDNGSVTKPELLGSNRNNTGNIYRYSYEIKKKVREMKRKRKRGLYIYVEYIYNLYIYMQTWARYLFVYLAGLDCGIWMCARQQSKVIAFQKSYEKGIQSNNLGHIYFFIYFESVLLVCFFLVLYFVYSILYVMVCHCCMLFEILFVVE